MSVRGVNCERALLDEMPSFNRLKSDVRQLADIAADEVEELNGAASLGQRISAATSVDDDGDPDDDNDVDDAEIGPPGFHVAQGETRYVKCVVCGVVQSDVVWCGVVRSATECVEDVIGVL